MEMLRKVNSDYSKLRSNVMQDNSLKIFPLERTYLRLIKASQGPKVQLDLFLFLICTKRREGEAVVFGAQ